MFGAPAAAPEETSELLADARNFGFDALALVELEEAVRVPQSDDAGVWPENWDAVLAFLSIDTQWRVAPIGGGLAAVGVLFIGLDYGAARDGLEAAGLAVTPALWSDLRFIERAARDALNEANR